MTASQASVGGRIPDLKFKVDVGPMKVFSVLMADPNPIHFDPDVVRGLGLGDRPVNQGTITMSYVVSAVIAWAGGVERLLNFKCRFLGNVVDGDEVIAGGEVTAVTTTDTDRTAQLDVWLERAGGQRAVEGSAIVRIS
jgi:acyl dehydratase